MNNLRKERSILVHNFRGFNPRLTGSIAFRPLARQKHKNHGGMAWPRKYLPDGSQEEKKERQEGASVRYTMPQ
jgi:hypothetical protein